MASPTWYFDGTLKRIYEVPPSAGFTVDGGGYRIYNGGISEQVLQVDVKKDLWSRWVDWHAQNDWALKAFKASGGNLRPTGENAPADFTLLTSIGWRIVLANYEHETIFAGNIFPEGANSLFDNSRLSVYGVVPRLQGSANLLTYTSEGGGGAGSSGPTAAEIRFEIDNFSKLKDIHDLAGLNKLIASWISGDKTKRIAGDIELDLITDGDGNLTIQRVDDN